MASKTNAIYYGAMHNHVPSQKALPTGTTVGIQVTGSNPLNPLAGLLMATIVRKGRTAINSRPAVGGWTTL